MQRARLGRAALWGVLGQLLSLAVNLWATPRLLAGLGEARYGAYAVLSAFAAYVLYVELGFGAAYTRALGLALAQGDQARAQRLIENAASFYTKLGALGGAALALAGVFFPPTEAPGASLALALWGGWFFASGLLSARRGFLLAAQRLERVARISSLWQPLVPLAQVLAVQLGGGLAWLAGLQLGGLLLLDLVLVLGGRETFAGYTFQRRAHPVLQRELRPFGLYTFGAQLAQLGLSAGDRVLVGMVAGMAAAAPYAVAASIGLRVRALLGALCWPFGAAAVARLGTEGPAAVESLLLSFCRRVGGLAALALAGALFVGHAFFVAWLGPRYAEDGARILACSVLGAWLSVLGGLLGAALQALNRPREVALSGLAVLLGLLGAGWPLARLFGPLGVALGATLGAALGLAVLLAALTRALGPGAGRRVLWAGIGEPAQLGGASAAVMWAGAWAFSPVEAFWSLLPLAVMGSGLGLALGAWRGAWRASPHQTTGA